MATGLPDDAPETLQRSARARVRATLKQLMQDNPDMSAPELADYFARTLPSQDRELVEAFLAAEARNILAFEFRAQISLNRREMFAALDVPSPSRIDHLADDEDEPKKRGLSVFDRISQWREFVPQANGNAPRERAVMEMTSVELRASAQFDAGKITAFGWKMIVKERMAEQLKEGEKVGDHFTTLEIGELIRKTRHDMASGSFRLRIPKGIRRRRNNLLED